MGKSITIKEEATECCTARNVLWYLVFFGFAVNYMIRINLNIAIVSMVDVKSANNIPLTSIIRFGNSSLTEKVDGNYTEKHKSNILMTPQIFRWNEKQQSHILGSFFWLHWTTQIPGGILASKYGTKLVFGLANFAGVLCCFLIPLAAKLGHYHLIFVRTFQGLLSGFAWPAMHNMTARWIPPDERSKFVTAYLGSSVGAALTYPICGFIIDGWGWELVFYACGVMGTLWYVGWWFMVYDSPTEHPRISSAEREYIVKSLGQSYTKEKAPIPWRMLLTSVPVLMNILAQWGGIWGLFTLMTHSPTYFKFIHGLNIQATGILSGMPHVLRMLWAYIFSQIGDYLLRTNKMSRTNVRKLATSSCTIGQGLFILALSFSGCNHMLAIIFLSISVALNGSVSTGPLASLVDISPNYAGVTMGLTNTAAAMVGFLTPAVVGFLTYQNQTVQQWQKVFWIAAFMLISTGTTYLIFAKSELQPWNTPKPLNRHPEEEMMVIKNSKDDESLDEGSDNGYKKVSPVSK